MIPVILSGGSGTRLWPVSRASFPKQFCELLDESLMEKTIRRLKPFGSPWALTVQTLDVLTERVFRGLEIDREQVLFEPTGRNTAPAIALLCQILKFRGLEKEIVGIFPADHLVTDEGEFQKAVRLAEACAREGYVATLGIRPSYAATGFGYIEILDEVTQSVGALKAHRVQGFREKPTVAKAEEFLAAKRFVWNAGIFVFRVQTMIANLIEHLPEVWTVMSELKSDLSNLSEVYARVPAISIDYGVMEKLQAQVCIPCDIGWSDLGSWDDVANLSQQSSAPRLHNEAHVASYESQNCFVFSHSAKVVGLIGVQDLIIVETPDALLVSRRGDTQNVRHVVEQLSKTDQPTAREHLFEMRPWGQYTILRDEPHYKSKVISVDPQTQISYQSHAKRAEQWVIVRGQGEVVLNDVVHPVRAGDAIHIPIGAKHRIRNNGRETLEFVEVQTGTYFGEDDIVRYQDDFNRK